MISTETLRRAVPAALLTLGLAAAPAMAWVPNLDSGDKDANKLNKAVFKNLTDIYKQQGKLVGCYVKASSKCGYAEAKAAAKAGTSVDYTVCNLATWDTSTNEKYVAAVAKCDSKVNYEKKIPKGTNSASTYGFMNCPGDADSTTTGVNEDYSDLAAWQAGDGERSTHTQIDALGAIVRGGVAAASGDDKMIFKDTGVLNKYGQGLFKAIGKCESDVKGKKGGGGLTDDTEQCYPGAAGADPAFAAAIDKEVGKAQKKLGSRHAAVLGLINTALGDAAQTTWNTQECGESGSPSGAFLDGEAQF